VDTSYGSVGEIQFRGMEGFEINVIRVENSAFTADAVVGEDKIMVLDGCFAENICTNVLPSALIPSRGNLFHFETPRGILFR